MDLQSPSSSNIAHNFFMYTCLMENQVYQKEFMMSWKFVKNISCMLANGQRIKLWIDRWYEHLDCGEEASIADFMNFSEP